MPFDAVFFSVSGSEAKRRFQRTSGVDGIDLRGSPH
jgi:hypothetical protein